MASPPGSGLPEFGLLRTSAGTAVLKLADGPRWLTPVAESVEPGIRGGYVETELVDLLLRFPDDVIGAIFKAGEDHPVDWSLLDAGLSAPLGRPGKVLALGRTFPAHARELGNEVRQEPLLFSKLPENLRGSGHELRLPRGAEGERFDNEIELAVVLGRDLFEASAEEAEQAMAAFTIANDFTWRSEQERARQAGQPWFLAKNIPGGLPLGPALVPKILLPEPEAARLQCWVDDVLVQDTSYEGMIMSPAALLAWLSSRQPLHAGDLILLGTPAGVSQVSVGSRVRARVAGLGELSFSLIGADA